MLKHIYLLALITLSACSTSADSDPPEWTDVAIIPLPQQLTVGDAFFALPQDATLQLHTQDPAWQDAAQSLLQRIEVTTGHAIPITDDANAAIRFREDNSIEHPEGYRLMVDKNQIEIAAQTAHGAFYAVQSLLQLMPAEVFAQQKSISWPIYVQMASIEDAPRFSYRGMHLDVGRHFFSVEEVKAYIDLLAMHKYNTFHWHLTEDQGWRIEIKQYPKLTEVGAFRKETRVGHASAYPAEYDGERYGGFYTQEDIKEVVAYAQKRFVTIIPEIELPGHAQAAIAAYPELGCTGEQLEVMTTWGVSENVYCPTEETFTFLENVLNEVMDLFPGEYIHIGGDECPKKQWQESAFAQNLIREQGLKDEFELQSYFIRRIEKMLHAKGKRLIGWDEILEGGLAPDATVMSWRGTQGGIEAASEGHDVIMTPNSHCYFDHYQSLHPDEPLAIGGYLPIERVYEFEPIPAQIPVDKQHHIIGAQANLWTEYIPDFDHLQYMAFPRGAALAEVVWSDPQQRDYTDFSARLIQHFKRYTAAGVPASTAFFELEGRVVSKNGQVEVNLSSADLDANIHYTLDGTPPSPQSPLYEKPLQITETSQVLAATFVEGVQKGRVWQQDINLHKAVGKPITLLHEPAKRYGTGGSGIILNGIYGNDSHFGGTEWLGFEGKNFEAVIDLGEPTDLTSVQCRFYQQNGAWIYLPKKVSVYSSTDGENFTLAGVQESIQTDGTVANPTIELDAKATHLKVVVDRYGVIPEGSPGATHEAWLFVGEIVVR